MTTEKNNKTKFIVLVVAIAAVTLAIIGAVVFLVKYRIDKQYDYEVALASAGVTEADGNESTNTDTEADTEEDLVIDDDESVDYTLIDLDSITAFWQFSLNGTDYELPTLLSAITDQGYILDTEDPTGYNLAAGYGHQEFLYSAEDTDRENLFASMEVYNPYGVDTMENDCRVVSLYVYSDNAFADNFTLNGGITFASSLEDLIAVYGEPSYSEESTDDDGCTSATEYWIGDDSFFNVLTVELDDGVIGMIGIDYSRPYEDYTYNMDDSDDELDLEEAETDEDGNLIWEIEEDDEDTAAEETDAE